MKNKNCLTGSYNTIEGLMKSVNNYTPNIIM